MAAWSLRPRSAWLTGTSTAFNTGYASLSGAPSSAETTRYDWLGRLADTQDSFGKHLAYSYSDADQQTRITDVALNKAVDYGYDALGRCTSESLTQAGLVQRHQTNSYNNQGWLTGVNADAGFDAGGGAALDQQLDVLYEFDAAGNRVHTSNADGSQAGSYAYDASGRMTSARDDKRNEVVSQIVYDGHGNRLSETRPGTTSPTTTYSYDAGNRVTASSAGEAWQYDTNGNTTYYKGREGDSSTTAYNAENRATRSVSTDKDNKATATETFYDAAGNLTSTRVTGDKYGFTELTRRDVRYLEQSKQITDSYVKGAKRLEGATSYTYDVNGNLTLLDRGHQKGADGNSVAVFDYDLDGHIIGRADKATALTSAQFFAGYAQAPDVKAGDTFIDLFNSTQTQQVRQQLFGGDAGASTHLQNYLYANNHPISEASGDQVLSLKKLTLLGGEPVRGPNTIFGQPGDIIGYKFALNQADILSTAGSIDRQATARRIASAPTPATPT